ncbi:MAG: hypothetical protein Q8S56_02920, partial [Polaromonas sp.]|nr:hypothetical protein [Polaromonas sp.]
GPRSAAASREQQKATAMTTPRPQRRTAAQGRTNGSLRAMKDQAEDNDHRQLASQAVTPV